MDPVVSVLKTKITTPFENFRNVELSFKHTGDLHNFECNGEYMKDGKKTEGQLTMITWMKML
jgi:hypothetical protein